MTSAPHSLAGRKRGSHFKRNLDALLSYKWLRDGCIPVCCTIRQINCGNLAPRDNLGHTCRQICNFKGREQRELVNDHPIKAIYNRRMNTTTQYLHRGKLDEQTAKKTKRLAKSQLHRTIKEVVYAQGRLRQRSRTGCLAEKSNSE